MVVQASATAVCRAATPVHSQAIPVHALCRRVGPVATPVYAAATAVHDQAVPVYALCRRVCPAAAPVYAAATTVHGQATPVHAWPRGQKKPPGRCGWSVETSVAVGTPMPTSSQITVFRGTAPHVYRLNAYNGDIRKVAVEIQIVPAADGRLATAALHMLPPCLGPFPDFPPLPGCTDKISTRALQTRILLVRPVFGGVETWDRSAPGVGQIYHVIPASEPWITDSTADLAALLADTAWNGGE